MDGAEEGWGVLRVAVASSWRSRGRWAIGGVIVLAAAVVPAALAYWRGPSSYNPLADGYPLPSLRLGLIALPLYSTFPFESGTFDVTVKSVARTVLVLGGALVVGLAGSEEDGWRGLAAAGAKVARNPIPLAAWVAIEVGVAGVGVGVLAGLVGGESLARWLRQILSDLWAMATVLVLPAIVLGGRNVLQALVHSVNVWRDRPAAAGVAAGGLTLAASGAVGLLDLSLATPIVELLSVRDPVTINMLVANLVLALPLAFYAALWFSVQAHLYGGSTGRGEGEAEPAPVEASTER